MIDIKYCPICKSKNIKIIKELEFRYPETIKNYYVDKRLRIAFDKIAKCDRREILKYNILQCNDCGFIYLNPRSTDEEVLNKYYWIVEGMGIKNPDTNKVSKQKTGEGLSWIDIIKEGRIRKSVEKYADIQARTLLDFGGIDGRMCINLRNKYDCELIDLVKVSMYKKVKYIGESLEYCKNKKYDIILLSHVLEHVNKPLEYLLVIKKYLKGGKGIIVISVPAGYFNEWQHIREPLTHCNYFSKDSLKRVMELAGLKTLEIKQYPFPEDKGEKEFGEIYYIGEKNNE